MAAVWDLNEYWLINLLESISEPEIRVIEHPNRAIKKVRCWGLELVPDYDYSTRPYAVARDNTGLLVIDLKRAKAVSLL